jgi:iron complex outermembrane receptor protein
MGVRYTHLGWALLSAASIAMPAAVSAAERRQIEEVIVTAERKESSVQDTSISITAFTSEMMDDFGIRNQSDLQNLVPATTIQPYDSTIRGVGRNFRNLGGDPGVATYINGVYSEDLYAATIGSFWDLARVEVLRGPQGTLYGRNAVGGAMNFLYKKPSDEFEFEAKTVVGDYSTRDYYAVVGGSLIEDRLTARLAASSREHDGWIEEKSGLGPDLDSGDEQNISLQLEWNINDNMSVHLRSNQANVDRVMGGANGGGLIVLTGENFDSDFKRNFTDQTHGLRAVDATITNPTNSGFLNPAQPVLTFTNPVTGAPILAQRDRPGVDPSGNSGVRNHGRNAIGGNDCLFADRDDIKGGDLCAYTNGLNNETYDNQGNQLTFSWDINEDLTFKYIFGYTTAKYERITDDDSFASLTDDRQFYVNHETEYESHEFQVFWDATDNVSVTSGVFFYEAEIDQRYDFYSSAATSHIGDPSYVNDTIITQLNAAAGAPPGFFAGLIGIPFDLPLTFLAGGTVHDSNSAQAAAEAINAPVGSFTSVAGRWTGAEQLGTIENGIGGTFASDVQSYNQTIRDSFAAYTQAVWDINDKFTLTAGIRYAKDDLEGEEGYAQYTESMAVINALAPFGLNLAVANILRGAIDPATLQPTGLVEPWMNGVPITFGAYRKLEREDSDVTWRVNLDYNLTDDTMIYANATTGYRGGGFNLAFFSKTPQYDPEELIAYELGYKGQFRDGSLQFNASAYFYDYKTIHTVTQEACTQAEQDVVAAEATNACIVSSTTTSVQAAPGAEMHGLEFEVLWLATDALTLGGNFSYTSSEYSESFLVVDGSDPTIPSQIYTDSTQVDRVRDIKGHSLPQIPEKKASMFASYNIPLGGSGEIDVMANFSYIDDVYFSAFEDPRDLAPSYNRIDLRASWTSPSEAWIVSGFLNNVADEIGIRQILRDGNAGGFRRTAQVTEPRMFGLELTYKML